MDRSVGEGRGCDCDLSLKDEKKPVGNEGRRCDGELRDGNAFWIFFRVSWPMERDLLRLRCREEPMTELMAPLKGRDWASLSRTIHSLGPECHGDGRGSLNPGGKWVAGCDGVAELIFEAVTLVVDGNACSGQVLVSEKGDGLSLSSKGTSNMPPAGSLSMAAAFSIAGVYAEAM